MASKYDSICAPLPPAELCQIVQAVSGYVEAEWYRNEDWETLLSGLWSVFFMFANREPINHMSDKQRMSFHRVLDVLRNVVHTVDALLQKNR